MMIWIKLELELEPIEPNFADLCLYIACQGPGQPTLDYINTTVGRSVPTGCDLVQLNAVVKTSP